MTYEEADGVGWLAFEFYNGAMSVDQCRRLLAAYEFALARPTRVLVLAGGREFWSNGMNLNVIEAMTSPADASWANIIHVGGTAVRRGSRVGGHFPPPSASSPTGRSAIGPISRLSVS